MTIRRKTAYNLDAQQVSVVLEAMKAHRRTCIEGRRDATTAGDEKADQQLSEKIGKYDTLIQYFEEKMWDTKPSSSSW
jgi:hypothetical protein